MAIPSNSPRQVATSGHEPALQAWTALCDEAVRRCSTQHDLPVTPSDEVRLRAWQLCWLALDAASAPANNLPIIADAQAWPPELIEQLRVSAALPKLNTQTWQALRRARDQQLFAALPPREPAAAEPIANEALAKLITEGLTRLGLAQLQAWITPSVTALITRWLSACLLALDALALSDDNSDATALELAVFVQVTLQRVHGAVATADDAAQGEPEQSATVSDRRVLEAMPGDVPAAALEPAPTSIPAPSLAVAQPSTSAVAAVPSAPQPTGAIQQPPTSSASDAAHAAAPQAATRPRRSRPRAIAQVASVVALAAVLLFMLRSGDAPLPDATRPTSEAKPPVATPEPSVHIVTPKPPGVEPLPNATVTKPTNTPQRSIKQPAGTAATQRPRFRNLAAAKRAHAAKKIDDVAYAAALAELEALRTAKIAKEQLELRSGKLSQTDYQRRVDAINRNLGFDRR